MSAAFDCVDHNILLRRLQLRFGMAGDVINWFSSFLTGRTQQVVYNGTMSAIQPVLFGVPQGSVLGPNLYVLYTSELESIVGLHGMKLHQYADDCQIYTSVSVADSSAAVSKLSACVAHLHRWLSANRLRLNPAKTQIMWLGSSQQLMKVDIRDIPILTTTVQVTDTARDLGVVIDSQLSLAAHVSALSRSGYYQLRQIVPLSTCCQVEPRGCLSMHLFHLAWTTATRYCTASRTGCCRSCSQFKMRLHVLSPELDAGTTSRWCCMSYTGCCQFDSALNSSLPV